MKRLGEVMSGKEKVLRLEKVGESKEGVGRLNEDGRGYGGRLTIGEVG